MNFVEKKNLGFRALAFALVGDEILQSWFKMFVLTRSIQLREK